MYLNLGSGKRNLAGFTNIDAVKHTKDTVVADILKLSYDDSSARLILSSHVIEHLDKNQLDVFFKECRRLLIKGGVLVLIAPCFTNTLDDYFNGEITIDYLDNFLFGLHKHDYDFHKQGIYKEKLERLCLKYNFQILDITHNKAIDGHELILEAIAV